MRRAFTPLSKKCAIKPPALAHVQTDGSYNFDSRISRTAAILYTPADIRYSFVKTYFKHKDSTESEWCSVLNGMLYSIDKNELAVELENDNASVIQALVKREAPAKSVYQFYYKEIFEASKNFEWLSVRWIPRRLNRADDLFRI
jgi:ribonuclease HI